MRADNVAVIVVNFNSGQCLQQCLDCLARQTVIPGLVVVVDNNSSDDSFVNPRCDGVSLKLLPQQHNLGFAAANNLAVEHCEAMDWVVLLNPDAFASANWIEALLDGTHTYTECQVFASRQLSITQGAKAPSGDNSVMLDGVGDEYHTTGLAWRRGHGTPSDHRFEADEPVFGPCAAAAMYRRSVFVEVGGFDEAYFCYFEDVDLAFRLQLRGEPCMYLAGARVDHIGSVTTGQGSDFSVYYGHRNLVWTFVKNMPGSLLWLYLPGHLILNVMSLLVFSVRGRARVIWRAKWDAVCDLPRVLRQRRLIQDQRRASSGDLRQIMTKGFIRLFRRQANG